MSLGCHSASTGRSTWLRMITAEGVGTLALILATEGRAAAGSRAKCRRGCRANPRLLATGLARANLDHGDPGDQLHIHLPGRRLLAMVWLPDTLESAHAKGKLRLTSTQLSATRLNLHVRKGRRNQDPYAPPRSLQQPRQDVVVHVFLCMTMPLCPADRPSASGFGRHAQRCHLLARIRSGPMSMLLPRRCFIASPVVGQHGRHSRRHSETTGEARSGSFRRRHSRWNR
jgi:hypothetical protein